MRRSVILTSMLVIFLFITLANATEEYSKITGSDCTACHPDYPSNYTLGPAGEYFKEHGTLRGYGEPPVGKPEPGIKCNACHGRMKVNYTPRVLKYAPENHQFELKHGDGKFWCLTCHDPADRTKLRLFNGSKVPLSDPVPLCGQCHGPIYRDWKEHIHGRWVGSIENAKPDVICTDCHNPHDPAFKPITPKPKPQYEAKPRMPEWYPLAFSVVFLISFTLFAIAYFRR